MCGGDARQPQFVLLANFSAPLGRPAPVWPVSCSGASSAGVRVRQVELGQGAAGRAVYVPPSGQQEQLDQIEVPAEEVERLRARGEEGVGLAWTLPLA